MNSIEHKEAVRLVWLSRHVPVRTVLIASLVTATVLSAVLTILAYGPANPIP